MNRSAPSRPSKAADLLLRDGTIYAGGPATGGASAAACRRGSVAIAGGRIVYAGPDAGADDRIDRHTEILDLGGRMVLPGFHDTHVHPLLGGVDRIECCLVGGASREEYFAVIREYAARNPDLPCIRGSGWIYGAFEASGPHKRELDRLVSDRPALFKAVDGHSAWVNSRALELAGIVAGTPDPPGGRIEREPGSGEPSGTLREWSAMDLVTRRLPPPAPETLLRGGRVFLAEAARFGITTVHEAMATASLLETYRALEERGELSLRVRASILCEPERARTAVAEARDLRARYASRLVRPEAAKLFLDGVVDAHTACLLEPYTDRPGFRGELLWPRELLLPVMAGLDAERFQVHMHAVGDGAARLALDSLEHAARKNGRRDSRHQIAHLDVLDPRDVPRLGALGIVAALQPAWFFMDSSFIDSYLPYLGRARAAGLYRMRELLDTGARVAGGSDWPFGGDQVTCNPLDSIQIGATRLPIRAEVATAPLAGEKVTVAELLAAYTGAGAFACFQEESVGSVEAGKLADLVVLDRNPLEVPLAEIHGIKAVLTLFEGKPVYRAAEM